MQRIIEMVFSFSFLLSRECVDKSGLVGESLPVGNIVNSTSRLTKKIISAVTVFLFVEGFTF